MATIAMIILAVCFALIHTSNGGLIRDQPRSAIVSTDMNGSDTKQDDPDWWKHTPVYQIYPRSFQDSDGDGVGDLKGIIQRVPYLHDLGIKAIWLSPIYDSPMADFGYDISNFTNIAPVFGTLEDFQQLVEEVHRYGMYLVMDFVPNHSSNKHEWFEKSIRKESPYDDYYIWRDTPNNWVSVFGNSSWQYVQSRGQYYLHQFLAEQPDLNYRNPQLRQEMLNVMHFWADHGVDGFRIDAIIYLVEDAEFRDEPRSELDLPPTHHDYLTHNYTQDDPTTYEVVSEWTKFLREYGTAHNKHMFSCTEGYTDVNHVMKYYHHGVDFPFNFNLIKWDSTVNATGLRKLIHNWMDHMPAGAWPNWVMGNHDNHRIASRLGGRQYVDVANILLMLLPGTPTYYNGDEIGMIDADISYDDTVDPSGLNWGPEAYANFSRDPERTPMQWDNTTNAGFTTGKPWLPMGPEWQTYNVENELKNPNSHLSIFKALVRLRQEPVFKMAANLRLIDVGDDNVLAFARESPDAKYSIVLNIGTDGRVSTIDQSLGTGNGRIVIQSANAVNQANAMVEFKKPFQLSNAQGYVIKLL